MDSFLIEKNKVNIKKIKAQKNKSKIVMITAYDALFAKIFDGYADMILVGDSLEMNFGGKDDTLSANMEKMLYHTKAVCNGAKDSLVIFDMPFGSYTTKKLALKNAIRVYNKTKAAAVKLEGGAEIADIVEYLCKNKIAVMGHIGLMPQFVRLEGGYQVKGKNQEQKEKLINDAKALEKAGVFCMVIEGVLQEVAKEVSNSVNIPLIGIGSGVYVDGQVLVFSDMLGLFDDFKPKFVKKYLDGKNIVQNAFLNYVKEVKEGKFPSKEYTY